jgi:hypothetical protein
MLFKMSQKLSLSSPDLVENCYPALRLTRQYAFELRLTGAQPFLSTAALLALLLLSVLLEMAVFAGAAGGTHLLPLLAPGVVFSLVALAGEATSVVRRIRRRRQDARVLRHCLSKLASLVESIAASPNLTYAQRFMVEITLNDALSPLRKSAT